ncbi:MAG: hypothetical protein JNG90_05940 [Planctomycetaceae bacterium]|nr:hypothetical protein [Planctomycetaceae bacterium]
MPRPDKNCPPPAPPRGETRRTGKIVAAPNQPAIPPKEEVGRWESEGGAPQGGRNPTAIQEGQTALPAAAPKSR